MLPGAVRRLDRPAVKPIMAIPRSPREGAALRRSPRTASCTPPCTPTRSTGRPPEQLSRVGVAREQDRVSARPPPPELHAAPGAARRPRAPVLHGAGHRCCTASPG